MDNDYNIYLSQRAKMDIKYLYTVQRHITFVVKVQSESFYGEHGFCVDKEDIQKAILLLDDISKNSRGECLIRDYESSSFIKLHFDIIKFLENFKFLFLKTRHRVVERRCLIVTGQFGFDSEYQRLRFSFEADETAAASLKFALEKMNKFESKDFV